jgi:hypothetical protein
MSINSIEVMCVPCAKCEMMKRFIKEAIRTIEFQNKIKIVYTLTHTPNLTKSSQYSVNASQAPIVLVNGNVEFSGQLTQDVVKKRLEALQRS